MSLTRKPLKGAACAALIVASISIASLLMCSIVNAAPQSAPAINGAGRRASKVVFHRPAGCRRGER